MICLFMGISLLMYVSDENEYYQYFAALGTGMAALGGLFLVYSQEVSKKMLCDCYPGIINIVDQGMRNGFNEEEDPVPTLQQFINYYYPDIKNIKKTGIHFPVFFCILKKI